MSRSRRTSTSAGTAGRPGTGPPTPVFAPKRLIRPGPIPDRSPKNPKSPRKDNAARLGAAGQRIVDLCAAANVVEAEELCDLLEEAGIQARIVGDVLGAAWGGLRLGETAAPHVWVLERDAIRTGNHRPLAQQSARRARSNGPEPMRRRNGKRSPKRTRGPCPRNVRFRFLSEGFWIAGGLCIVIGGLWAWQNWRTLSSHPATADGRLIGIHWRNLDTPDQDRQRLRLFCRPQEVLHRHNKRQERPAPRAGLLRSGQSGRRRRRADRAPWVVLAFSIAVGLFLSFVGYQFR